MGSKRRHKVWRLTVVAMLAFSCVTAADASAASFASSGTGPLSGKQTVSQTFDTGTGSFSCTQAAISGMRTEIETEAEEIGIKYSACSYLGFVGLEVSEARYLLGANGSLTILNTFTVRVPGAGCSITFGPQTPLGSVSYVNSSGKIEAAFNLGGIKSKGSGGLCGGESASGTYAGKSLIELVGGTIEWVP